MSRHLQNEKKSKSTSKTWLGINSAFLFLYTVLAGFFIFKMYSHHFLAFRNVNHILTAILIAIFVFALILLLRKKAKYSQPFFYCSLLWYRRQDFTLCSQQFKLLKS